MSASRTSETVANGGYVGGSARLAEPAAADQKLDVYSISVERPLLMEAANQVGLSGR